MNNMPPVTKNLLIINVLFFAARWVAALPAYGIDLDDVLGLHFFMASHFYFYQIFKRFLFYYLTCGLGAGLMQELVQYIHYLSVEPQLAAMPVEYATKYLNLWTTVGASGAVYGILLSFGMTFPNERMFIFPLPVPIRAKFFVVGYAVLLLLYWRNGGGSNNRGHRNYYDRDYYNRGSGGFNFRQWLSKKFTRKNPDIKVTYGGKYEKDFSYR